MSNSNTLHEIDLRIRTLSTLISVLGRQVEQPKLSTRFRVSPTSQACSHFATLLTRGHEDCNDKAKGPGRGVIAVAAKLTSEVTQLVVSGSLDETEDQPNKLHNIEATAAQNLTSGSTDVFQIQVIQPSETTLAKLVDAPVKDDKGLHYYAQDLLATIRDLRTSPSTNYPLFRRFVLRSCLVEIGHCLASDKYLFPRPLEEILGNWKPLSHETFRPKRIWVSVLFSQLLANWDLPIIGNYCQWSPETAPTWIELLRHMSDFVKTRVRDCRIRTLSDTGHSTIKIDNDALGDVDMALPILMFIRTLPLFNVFNLPSMRVLLSGDDLASGLDSGPDVVDVDDEDPRELPEKNVSKLVLDYLDNVVAWHRAVQYVHRGVQNHMGEISLTMVHTPTPASHRACAPAERIVKGAILKRSEILGIEELDCRMPLIGTVNDKLRGRMHFTGTVHCEASLMGLIASSIVDAGPLPDDCNKATFKSIFKSLATEKGLVTIVAGRKCCWCCAWLAQRLHLLHPEIKFDIPESHGKMYPWALPLAGISVEDALALESELGEMWDRVVDKLALQEELLNIVRCQTNSPSSSPADLL